MYKEYSHSILPEYRNEKWVDTTSEVFEALQRIVLHKSLLNDLNNLVRFSHTVTLEIYHALYNN